MQGTLLVVLLSAGFMAVTGWLRTDLLGLSVLFALATSGLVSPQEAFQGFSSPAVITLAGLFVLTAAMNKAGFVHWVAARVERMAGDSESRVMGAFILMGATLSLVVNTAAAGAVLIPAVVGVAKQKNIAPSKLLLPMGFGVIVGGTATIFTTANIVMSGLLVARGHRGLTLLDFFPTGGVLVLVTLVYFLVFGQRLLPTIATQERRGLGAADLAGIYSMEERLWEVKVGSSSPLCGKTLEQSPLGVPVLAIWRQRRALPDPGGDSVIEGGDFLLVSASREAFERFEELQLTVGRDRRIEEPDLPVVMVEAVIPPRSKAVGKTLVELSFRKRYGLTAVALWRGGESHLDDVGSLRLQAGDALLTVGPVKNVLELSVDPNYLLVDTPAYPPLSRFKSALTLLLAGCVLASAGLGLLSMSLASFSGALLLTLLGVMTAEAAYEAIDWRVLFLIAGMFPMAHAMETTGLTTLFSAVFSQLFADSTALLPLAAIYLFTVFMTQVVGGQVSALFTGPAALSVASTLGIDMTAMAVLVGVACSNCFITAIAHPVNLLVSGPGGYRSKDFLRVGIWLQLLCFLAAMFMARFYWGIA